MYKSDERLKKNKKNIFSSGIYMVSTLRKYGLGSFKSYYQKEQHRSHWFQFLELD